MGTRAVIAYAKGDSWEGVYNHFDGFPTVTGAVVWAMVQEMGAQRFKQECILDHPEGYSSFYADMCYCHHENFKNDEHGKDCWAIFRELTKAGKPAHAGGMRWAYVVGTNALTAFMSLPMPKVIRHRPTKLCKNTWSERFWGWVPVGTFLFEDPEPDWEDLEARTYVILEREMARFYCDLHGVERNHCGMCKKEKEAQKKYATISRRTTVRHW